MSRSSAFQHLTNDGKSDPSGFLSENTKTMGFPKYHGEMGLDMNILLPWIVIGWDMLQFNDPGSAMQGEVL